MNSPMHERIADALRRQISDGELAIGDPLPSEAQLREQWQGSRTPVRQALATLRAEGLIGGGPGKPPVVRRTTLLQPFDTFLSFSRWVEQLGQAPGQRTIECALRPATAALARTMGLPDGEPVVQLVRLRLIDGAATMLERTTFTAEYGRPLFTHDLDSGSIYEILIAGGLKVGLARHIVDAVGADQLDAELLGVEPGAPLLRERRLAFTESGALFEYSDDRYRPDLVSFTIDNSPQGTPSPGRQWSDPRTQEDPT